MERLRAEHADAVLAFERENRAWFSRWVPDRGDSYFADFTDRHTRLLDEQAAGRDHFHVLLDETGAVVGRFNLVDAADGTAELGFRVAERAAGRGVATAAVRRVCVLAREEYGLWGLRAAAGLANHGSRRVLERTGFTPVGEVLLGGERGTAFVLEPLPVALPEP
ncbi:GNAT family N-acetyltransferase [Streptomyces sp. ventii]|uniref:GNAT family N-acetyltransferase n=1 Tax=Streptomyces spiramenti TaxID=2720606 RepID=A0ABX1AJ72_9ACTN|nr:GNAT family N-acetyltransferase [Streptomyces spiramenti]NJP66001.1 GNAT family N-acetyltransferase [Streptomyces spiramenti]